MVDLNWIDPNNASTEPGSLIQQQRFTSTLYKLHNVVWFTLRNQFRELSLNDKTVPQSRFWSGR